MVHSHPHPAGSNQQSGSIQHTKEIEKVQRTACRLIMGAFHSMATDILKLHANIDAQISQK